MKRVNDYEFYQLALAIHPLMDIEEDTQLKDCWSKLFRAKRVLEYLLADELIPLIITKPVALLLQQAIVKLIEPSEGTHPAASERKLDFSEVYAVRSKAREFETVLSAELQSLATYFVSQKLAYETRLLIEEAERVLPSGIVTSLDDATIEEIRQAGRCMAFSIPTAVGFHILRATETVIRKYYHRVIGTLPSVKMRNWGSYIRVLRDSGKADAGILVMLEHIRVSYRNPVLHPEVMLSEQEAQVLMNVCIGSISQMVLVIQKMPPTP